MFKSSSEESITKALQAFVTKTAKQVDDIGLSGFSLKQRLAIEVNPKLFPLFRGYNIDKLTRELVKETQYKNLLGKINKGPDFFNSKNIWWDMTTKSQWKMHEMKYSGKGYF